MFQSIPLAPCGCQEHPCVVEAGLHLRVHKTGNGKPSILTYLTSGLTLAGMTGILQGKTKPSLSEKADVKAVHGFEA